MKRSFDFCFSLLGFLLFSPVFLVIAVALKLESPGPVFYRGLRVGRGGRRFHMLKFRSMVSDADRIGGPSTSEDDPRVTRAGRFMRRFKLDELPQLFNVLRGEMSFVGPRPEVPLEVDRYTPEQRALLTVPPGITDYASIRFRNEGEILKGAADPHEAYRRLIQPEKLRLGLRYVQERSFWVDMKIIFQTLKTVVAG